MAIQRGLWPMIDPEEGRKGAENTRSVIHGGSEAIEREEREKSWE